MRLPKDTDNWTGIHTERAIAEAWKLFDRYEAKIDFEWPQEKQDKLYRPYQLARQLAVDVANHTNYMVKEANALP